MWDVSGALGKFFFVAGLMPALAFFAACDLVIIPRLANDQHLVGIELLAIKGAVYVVGGSFLGFLLLSLNTPIIRLFENGLIVSNWLLQRNLKQNQRYYALIERRSDYRKALEGERNRGETSRELEAMNAAQATSAPRSTLETTIAKLEDVHKALERKYGIAQSLPHNTEYVKPTKLGNVFAVIEEYPYERYGMDAMVYWPRMMAVIPEDYKSQIADLKTTLDFLLNLSLLAGLFALGALGMAAWFLALPELIYGLLALTLSYVFYRLSVGTARELGNAIMASFDLFRSALIEKFNLPKPASLITERRLWLLLASFIRRGEEFYFPLELENADDHALLQQVLSRHTHNLYKLQEQAAVYGASAAPLFLLNQIEGEAQIISEITSKMRTEN